MPTWSGWIIEFLNRANILNTPPLQTFMSEWAKHDANPCKNAPIVLSAFVTGATRCGATVTDYGYTYKYPSHAAAAHAFQIQIHNTRAKDLLDVLNSGNPFQVPDRSGAVAVLKHWGSPAFASWYLNANSDGTTGGGSGGGHKGARAHGGWNDLRRSVNKHMPQALRHSERNVHAALRSLSRGSKVRL